MIDPVEKLQRLRAATVSGHVPADVLQWAIAIASASVPASTADLSPFDRLTLEVSALIDDWMKKRRVTGRTISVSRRTLARALKGENLTFASLVDIADALNCDVAIAFRPRGVSGATAAIDGTTPL